MDFDDDMNLVTCGPNQEQASTQEKIGQELCTLPQEFPFVRTDEEVIAHYLKKKINHEPVPHSCTVNIYEFNPQELTETYPSLVEDEWYFFTPRARNYPHGNLSNRAAGKGYWKATGAEKQIYLNNVCIGSKKSLVFYEGKVPNGKKTDRVMHEYVDYQPSGRQQANDAMLLDRCVLCQIHMNSSRFAESKKRAFASSSSQIGQQETDKSFENENEAAYKRVKIEQQEHYCLPGHPNLPVLVQQQNLSGLAYNNNLGGWFNCCPESTSEIHSDNLYLEIGPESYFGQISNDVMDNIPYQNIYNLTPCNSSMDCSGPDLSSINNINHHQEAFSKRENKSVTVKAACLFLERNLDK